MWDPHHTSHILNICFSLLFHCFIVVLIESFVCFSICKYCCVCTQCVLLCKTNCGYVMVMQLAFMSCDHANTDHSTVWAKGCGCLSAKALLCHRWNCQSTPLPAVRQTCWLRKIQGRSGQSDSITSCVQQLKQPGALPKMYSWKILRMLWSHSIFFRPIRFGLLDMKYARRYFCCKSPGWLMKQFCTHFTFSLVSSLFPKTLAFLFGSRVSLCTWPVPLYSLSLEYPLPSFKWSKHVKYSSSTTHLN